MSDTEQSGDRIVAGIRMDKRTLKVLKGIAEYLEVPFGDMVEGIILQSFEGKCPFNKDFVDKIDKLRAIYGLDAKSDDLFKGAVE
jgi:hypothetical protein